MFCSNCGEKVANGSWFCGRCGAKVMIKEVKTPNYESSGKSDIEDKYIWPLACSPLIGYIIAVWLSRMGYYHPGIITAVCFVMNCTFLSLDIKYLRERGLQPEKWLWLGIVFAPIYIGVRAYKTNKNYIPLITYLILTAVGY